MEATKQLGPMFLMEAMENAEQVAHARIDPGFVEREALQAKLDGLVEACRREIEEAIEQGNVRRAAELLHQSRYHRKALRDLQGR